MSFSYNSDEKDYTDFIGEQVRNADGFLIGEIISIRQWVGKYGHQNVAAIVRRTDGSFIEINCRRFQ